MRLIEPVDLYMEETIKKNLYRFFKKMEDRFLKSGSIADLAPQIEKLLSEDLSNKLLWIIGKDFTRIYNPKFDNVNFYVILSAFPDADRYIIYTKNLQMCSVSWAIAEAIYKEEQVKERACKSKHNWIMREFVGRKENENT